MYIFFYLTKGKATRLGIQPGKVDITGTVRENQPATIIELCYNPHFFNSKTAKVVYLGGIAP
jgi:hypothetical protein